MTDLNKEREAFEEAYLSVGGKQRELELEDGEYTNSKSLIGWDLWQIKAKAQAVPDTHLLVPKEPVEDVVIWLLCEKDIGDNLPQAEYFYKELVKKFVEASESGAEG